VRGVLIGRFQPFHSGHLEVVRRIRAERPAAPLIIGVGSAEQSYTWENPFTAGERVEMIERALREASVDGTSTIPIADIHRHSLWVKYLEGLLPPFDRVYTNNELTRLLFERAGYTVEGTPLFDRVRFEGVRIREAMAEGKEWRDRLPPAVVRYLDEIDAAGRLRLLRTAPPAGEGGGGP